MSTPLRVLILEDCQSDVDLMLRELHQGGFAPDYRRVDAESDYLAALETNPELILADWSLPQFSGLRALQLMNQRGLEIPFIIVSGSIGEEAAVDALRLGAADYLLKDRLARLGQAVQRALEDKQLRQQRRRAEEALKLKVEQLAALNQVSRTITTSLELDQVLAEVMSLAGKVTVSDYASILLVDETGRIGEPIENLPGRMSAEQLARKRGFTSWIIHSHEPVVVDEISERGTVKPKGGEGAPRTANPHLVSAGIKSFVGLPLIVEERIVGVLYLHSLRPGTFHDQLPLLTTFASQAAIAIEKARLYDAVQKELEERKQAEREILLLSQAVKSVSESVTITDENDNILFVNEAALSTYGYERDELIGQHISFVRSEKNPPEITSKINSSTKKAHWEGELVNKRKDGSEFPIYLSTSPVRDEEGNIIALIGVAQDITERKRAEDTLRQSEERFREIFENMSSGVVVYQAAKDGQDFVITDFNRAAERIERIQRESVIGKAVCEAFSGVKEFGLFEVFQRVWKTGKPEHFPIGFYKDERIAGWRENYVAKLPSGEVVAVYDDVTEHKQAEEALRESERRFSMVFQASPVSICISSVTDGRLVDANPAFLDLFGYTREQAIGHTSLELNMWYDPQVRAGLVGKLSQGEEISNIEMRIRQKNGEFGQVLLSAELIDLGSERYMLSLLNDITERKRVEHALAEERARVRLLMDTIPDAIYFKDAESRFTQISQALAHRFGLSDPAQAIGKTDFDFFTEEHARQAYEDEQNIIRSGQPVVNQEEKETWLDGGVGWVSTTKMPLYDQEGRIVGTFGISRDVTERKQAEQALRESEERLRQITSSLREIIWLRAAQTRQVLYVNPAFEELTGQTCESFYENPDIVIDAIHPDDKERVIKALEQRSESVSFDVEHRIVHLDGSVRWVLSRSFPVRNEAGEVYRWTSIMEDITERKRAEEALAQERNLLRSLIDNVPDYIYVKDTHSRFLVANPALAHLVGASTPDELLGKTDFDFFPKELAAKYYADEQALFQSGQALLECEENTIGSAGNPKWVSSTKVPLRDAQGHIFGLVGMGQEITTRKRAEEELNWKTAFLETLLNSSIEGILVVDSQGKKIFQNQRCIELWKIPKDIVENNDDQQQVQFVMNRTKNPEQFVEKVVYLYAHPNEISRDEVEFKDGMVLDRYSAPVMGVDGTYYGRIWAFRDITERKLAEEKLTQQAEELRQRNEELARLYRASGSLISGEVLTPRELAEKIVGAVLQEFGQVNCSLIVVQKETNQLVRLAIAGPYADQVSRRELAIDGPGLVAQVIRTGEAINSGDVRSLANYLPNWDLARSELTIPLKLGNNVIGVIDVQSSEPNAFSPDDERLMAVFAERAATALEHSRLNAQTEARMQQLVALRTVDMAITGSFDVNLTLGILLDQLIGQLGIHAADALAFNPVTQTFKLAGQRGFRTPILQSIELNYGAGLAWRVVRERQRIIISNLQEVSDSWQRSPDLFSEQFLAYIGIPLVAKGQIKGVLEVFHRESLHLDQEHYSFLEMLAGQAAIAIDNGELFERLQSSNAELSMAYDSTLEGWARALELRDGETEGHSRRVTDITLRLARELGVSENNMVNIYRGALLHDIGKMGVPDSIMLKPGPLTDEEWALMRKHPQYAYDMLSPISYLHQALDIPYCHHEKWDGTGYPRGLKGEQIPLAARIFAVVDVWDALTSNRPYRKAWSKAQAQQYIEEQAGLHFDPKIVPIFLRESFKKG